MYSGEFNNVSQLPPARAVYSDNGAKTLICKTREDCKKELYRLYGNDYEVTWQRPIMKGGILGLFQREYFEVHYVVRPKPMSPKDSFQQSRDEILKKTTEGSITSTMQIAALDKKIEGLTKMMTDKLDFLTSASSVTEKHPSIQKIEELLQKNEFSFSYINSISNRLRAELAIEELDDFDAVERTVVDWIGNSIKIYPQTPVKLPHVIVLVGPTGVGKTTTIAKLAGMLILDAKEKKQPKPFIRMITIDHTRVAAEAQLKTFGDLMQIDVDKAESSSDVKKIFDTYKENLDVLFIDTPGYSPNDSENIGKMKAILDIPGLHPEIYLTVTASVKAMDLVSIIQNYEQFAPSSVIVTKWDETRAYGNVLSVLSEKGKAISYITDGQKVPKEIERATVSRFLLNLNDFNIDRMHIEDAFPEEK